MLIPRLSGVGAAIGTLISVLFVSIMSLVIIGRTIGIPSFVFRRSILITIASLLSIIPLILVKSLHINQYFKLIAGLMSFLLTYALLAFLLGAVTIKEVSTLFLQIVKGTPVENYFISKFNKFIK